MSQVAPLEPHRFTRAEYEHMANLGALADMPVELLDGVIVTTTPQGPEHAPAIQALTTLLAEEAAAGRLRIQLPLATSDDSEPEPDVALAQRPARRGHPHSAALVIEVVVSKRAEAVRKTPIYAQASVAEYWIVDVPRRHVLVHDTPADDGYANMRTLSGEDELCVPDSQTRFTVDELFEHAGL
jgi:Uma2 family endonuclease